MVFAPRGPGPLARRVERVLRDQQLAEDWIYRYLAAAHANASTETAALAHIAPADAGPDLAEPGFARAECTRATSMGRCQRTLHARSRRAASRDPGGLARREHAMTVRKRIPVCYGSLGRVGLTCPPTDGLVSDGRRGVTGFVEHL